MERISSSKVFCKFCKGEIKDIIEKKVHYHYNCHQEFILDDSNQINFGSFLIIKKEVKVLFIIENLNNCKILRENISIGSNNRITKLDLNNKHLTKVPHEIRDLEFLKILVFRNNNLISIPESMFFLSNIKFLDFSHNKIEILSSKIEYLKNLHYLELSNNNLRSIPESLSRLNKLMFLNISNNPILDSKSIKKRFSNIKTIWF
jgi:Leucine-rich repeat (LRR) protein